MRLDRYRVVCIFVWLAAHASLADSIAGCATTNHEVPPKFLSQTCLYDNISTYKISDQLQGFTPNYQLWSDGANKFRWVYIPDKKQINNHDPDHWVFPVGTQFFKQFNKTLEDSYGNSQEIRVETRHLKKIAAKPGINSWLISTYAWLPNQKDAVLSDGVTNALNTGHRIPTNKQCIICHKGNVDGILGFDAIQLSDAQSENAFGHGPQRTSNQLSLANLLQAKTLNSPVNQPRLPGNRLQQQVLGYLHANCGNCHNPKGHAAEEDAAHLNLRHQLSFNTVEATKVWQTAVNQTTQNFTAVPYIVMGAKHEEMAIYQSALMIRMNSLDENYRMPMIGREQVDYSGLALMHRWLLSIDTPEGFNFPRSQAKHRTVTPPAIGAVQLKPVQKTLLRGLNVQLSFYSAAQVPAAMVIYWPEDSSLTQSAVMDHQQGDFTDKLIVARQGSVLSLRNSDDVGHTIYVKDKRKNIRWQLNYMPPNSRFEQKLFWQEDTFVEMRCRLHLYMSAWVGSISSRYYKIIELNQRDLFKNVIMTDYPEHFTQVKIWLPNQKLITTHIKSGETKQLQIGNIGELLLSRVAMPKLTNPSQ